MDDDEYYGEAEICCPFCGKADDCKHLVAALDHENAAIGGGVFFDREVEITKLIHDRFIAIGPASGWKPPRAFVDLWGEFQAQPEEGLDTGPLTHLLDDLLGDTDAIREGGEGVVAYFDRKPAKVFEQVVKAIQQACGVSQ
jgi:hypothetical protein